MTTTRDFSLAYVNGETLGRLKPNNEAAKKWLRENIENEPWQWLGNSLYVEHRYIDRIISNIEESGFTIDLNY